MFTNLELFLQEKEVYNQKVAEIKGSQQSPEDLAKNLMQAKENFRAQIRKYLSGAINTMNTFFQCQYSIYKVGKDFDANFHVVETNVRKTRAEVVADMEQFKKQAMSMTLSDDQIMKINIAMDILLTYSDDAVNTVDSHREHYLEGAKVVATSIMETPVKQKNSLEEKPIQQPNFNPYANQPVQLDTGFSNPVYEKKTLVDPFAGIYGGDLSTQGVEPTASNPVPQNPMISQQSSISNPPVDSSLSIFGQGVVMGGDSSLNGVIASNNSSNSDSSSGFKFFNNVNSENVVSPTEPSLISTDQNHSLAPQAVVVPTYNPVQQQNLSPTDTDTFTAYLKPESMDSVFGEEEDEKKKEILLAKEKSFLGSKIIKGILVIPLITFLFFEIVMLIFWVLGKFGLIEELTNVLGKGMIYAEFALCMFFALMASSVALDTITKKTKYISKHAVASLTLFSVVIYGLTELSPNISDLISKVANLELSFQIFLHYSSCLVFAFFVGTFIWLFSFLRTKKDLIKRKLNMIEILGFIWLIYTLVLPAISIGTSFIGLEGVSSKLSLLYDYPNSNVIVIIASFVLSLGLLFFSKREEELL